MQRLRKGLFQSALYGLSAVAMAIPVSGWAAGWTQEFGKVIGTNSTAGAFYVWLDPQVADNVNNCVAYIGPVVSGWFGQNLAVFSILYPTVGVPSEAQKVMISQVSLAVATGKRIKIYSSACNSGTHNNVDQIWLNSN
ncbi:MAG TPA: hypothetical protein VEB01_12560 [Methylocaldum sp.]|nr:hypothetical protein [Methylocaldum sp.]